ncbi:MAG: hypothetical protein Q8M29_07280 [Bacteroidota bacterium]|nr:hypothetical protein [Bacteroidota bacterium]
MSGTITHYLSKEEVSEKLQGVSYSFQESYWESFLESQSSGSIKFVSPKSPSSIKLTPKLIAIPVSLIAISAIIYFSVSNLKSENSSKEPKKNTEEATMLVSPQPKENTVTTPLTNTAKTTQTSSGKEVSPVTNNPKQEPLVTAPTHPAEGKEPAKTEKKEDTSAAGTQTSKVVKEEKNKVVEQASVVNEEKKESTGKKKKKKRNRKKDSENKILIPSPEEDNVVIPEN